MKPRTLIFGLLGGVVLAMPGIVSVASAETAAAFNDPVSYCKTVGAIDTPDAKYKGPAVPDWMVAAHTARDQGAEELGHRSQARRRLALHGSRSLGLRARQQPDLWQGEPEQDPDISDARVLRRAAECRSDPAVSHRA
jgi:hypothetical protein